jgi:hypothetical protein
MTPVALLIGQFVSPVPGEVLTRDRAVETLVGAAVALGSSWPRPSSSAGPSAYARMMRRRRASAIAAVRFSTPSLA